MKSIRMMSLLEYDVKKSTQHRLQEYDRMSIEQKSKKQEEYLNSLVARITDCIQVKQASGTISIKALPKQLYPFDKMIRDIILELKKVNIEVTRANIIKNRYKKCIVGCRIHWKKVDEN